MHISHFKLVVAACVLGLSASVSASVMRYDGIPSFLGATSGLTLIDFEGIAPIGGAVEGTSVTLSNVTFVANPFGFVVDSGFAPLFDWGSGAVLTGGQTGATLSMLLPGGVTALGMELMTAPEASPLFVLLSSGDSFIVNTVASPGRTFIGFTSDADITSVLIAGSASVIPMVDNFSFGQNAVPAPGTLPLVLGGLGLVGIWLRRKV